MTEARQKALADPASGPSGRGLELVVALTTFLAVAVLEFWFSGWIWHEVVATILVMTCIVAGARAIGPIAAAVLPITICAIVITTHAVGIDRVEALDIDLGMTLLASALGFLIALVLKAKADGAAWRRAIEQAIPGGLVAVDADGRQTYVNEAFCSMVGLPRSELEGRKPPFAYWHPDHRKEIELAFSRALNGEFPPQGVTLTFRRADGEAFAARVLVARLGDNPASARWVAHVTDVEEQVRAHQALAQHQRRLREALSAGRVAVWECDKDLSVTYFNAPETDPAHPLDRSDDRVWNLSTSDLDDLLSRLEIETVDCVPDQISFEVQHCGLRYAVKGHRGRNAAAMTGVVIDVTDKHSLETERARLREAEVVTDMAGMFAHDVSNILQIIVSSAEELSRMSVDADTRRAVEDILMATDRGALIAGTLLRSARGEKLLPRQVDIAEIIGHMKPFLERVATSWVHLDIDLPNTPVTANIVEGDLINALVNLVANARDAMENQESGEISIRVENSGSGLPGNPGMLRIAVSDTGPGMSPDVRSRVLEPYFTTKPPARGTGLGLPSVAGFVTAAGGRLDIESEPGAGTTVTILLPETVASLCLSEAAGDNGNNADVEARVLLVDDEAELVEMVAAHLSDIGYDVSTATSFDDAREALSRQEFDLLFSDMHLDRGRSGERLAELATNLQPRCRVLLSSGAGDAGSGLWPVISKPYHGDALGLALRRILNRRRAVDEKHPT